MNKTLFIRADADAIIGTGHVMRCLALAQVWQEQGGTCAFLMAKTNPEIQRRLHQENMKVIHQEMEIGSREDVQQTVSAARQVHSDWIVLDGYRFDAAYQRGIASSGIKSMCIDDYGHADHYYADIVLNQNLNISKDLYTNYGPHTRFLLGSKYVMLRNEFRRYEQKSKHIKSSAGHILVTLGGGDSTPALIRILHSFRSLDISKLQVKIVIGKCDKKQVIDLMQESQHSFELVSFTNNMVSLMKWADLAISSSGSTCWELAYMGVPIITIILAKNQEAIATQLDREHVAKSLGWFQNCSPSQMVTSLMDLIESTTQRKKMSRLGQGIVDGKGCDRILRVMSEK